MTKIIRCGATEETCDRLEGLMPEELKDKKLILNIGNSEFKLNDETEKDFAVINNPESIKKSVDKREMFKIFQKEGINALKFRDLDTTAKRLSLLWYVIRGGKVVLRGEKGEGLKVIDGNTIKGLKQAKKIFDKKRYSYATIKEDKILEYRFIVLDEKILRVMVKINTTGAFRLKQDNCKFVDCDIYKFPYSVRENIINSVRCLGLRLSGVDVLINTKGEFKIIEVNSGMALGEKSVKKLYDTLKEIYLFFGDFV